MLILSTEHPETVFTMKTAPEQWNAFNGMHIDLTPNNDKQQLSTAAYRSKCPVSVLWVYFLFNRPHQ